MPIKVSCPNCPAKFNAPGKAAGKSGKCPKCGGPITVPNPAPVEPPPTFDPVVAEPAPAEVVAHVAPPAHIAPPSFDPPAATPQVSIDHNVRAKGSFFTMFKGTLGCLAAIGVVVMIGCVGVVAMLGVGGAVAVEAAKEVSEAIEEAQDEIAAKADDYEAAVLAVVSKLVVVEARVEPTTGDFRVAKNHLYYTIRNDSDQPIAEFSFDATITAPGRSIPIAEGRCREEVPGGLEPGETKEFDGQYVGDLGRNEAPAGSTLTIAIDDAQWPGKPEDPLGF